MAASAEPGDYNNRLKRALETDNMKAVRFLILAKEELGDYAYKDVIKAVQDIVKQSADPDGGITIEECKEILSEVFAGRTRLLNSFHHFIEARDPFHDDKLLLGPISFLAKVKASPYISNEGYNELMTTLCQFWTTTTMTVEEVYEKVKKILGRCPEFIEIFKTYLPPHLREPVPIEQSSGSPKTSPMGEAVLSFRPDAYHSSDGIRMKASNIKNNLSRLEHCHDQNHEGTENSFRKKHTQRIPGSFRVSRKEGNGESLHAEEHEGDKIDPLPDWSPSRENELPPKVDFNTCKPCTISYFLLPKNCLTLQSSYQTELGRSIFNDTLVSGTSGSEDCFKFRTKNQYEETIFKCEDDMCESDMLVHRFRATADFIRNLQDRVNSLTKIEEHLTPIHRRCIEQLYDDCGLDVLDGLSETRNISAALAILHSRLNQKVEDLSEARLYFHKVCANIIADNYCRSLDHRSSSFKQLDTRRMNLKDFLAEAKEINMRRLKDGDKHPSSASTNQSCLVSDDVLNYSDDRIHEDIDRIICEASSKPMMSWTELVRPFVSANCQLPELNGTVAPKEVCERCGLSQNFSIPSALIANKSTSIHGGCEAGIEDGEAIPDVKNIQVNAMLGPGNVAATYDGIAAPIGDESSFWYPGRSICDHVNKCKVQHESQEGSNVEMDNLDYSKRIAELNDVWGGITCCSLVVLCRLHQIFYERLRVAKLLSREASAKAISRGSHTCDLYAKFKAKLGNLLGGYTDNSSFEEYCLNFLGPRSYVLFTLDKLISLAVKQLSKICAAEENSLQLYDQKERRPNPSKDLLNHQDATSSPDRPTIGSLEQDQRKERDNGSMPPDDTVKPAQNHFQRRKKRKLETAATLSQPGLDNSNS